MAGRRRANLQTSHGKLNAYTAVTDQFNQTLLTQGADDAYPILANSLSTFEALESDFTL